VHRGLLKFYSGYFQAALDGGFAEAQSRVIKLETEEPAVFEEFVLWLYTKTPRAESTTRDNCLQHYESTTKLWIFADRRDIPLLMNEMIDSFQQSVLVGWTTNMMPNNVINNIYENITEDCELRRMFTNMYWCMGSSAPADAIAKNPEDFHDDFLFDLVKYCSLRRGLGQYQYRNRSFYSKKRLMDNLLEPEFWTRLSKEQYKKYCTCSYSHVHENRVRVTCAEKEITSFSNVGIRDMGPAQQNALSALAQLCWARNPW
jgi:hypothetical protein